MFFYLRPVRLGSHFNLKRVGFRSDASQSTIAIRSQRPTTAEDRGSPQSSQGHQVPRLGKPFRKGDKGAQGTGIGVFGVISLFASHTEFLMELCDFHGGFLFICCIFVDKVRE